jgi:hypothetical protein
MTTKNTTASRIERSGHLRWVRIADMHVNERAQRELRPGWAAQIAAEFDPDRFMPPLVSLRDAKHYVIDGQHRIEAMRIMGWDDQQVQCHVFEGLSEAEEADLFLWHNNRKTVGAYEKFMIATVAGRPVECDIERIVLANGLKIASTIGDGAIKAVGALRKVYTTAGPTTLGRALRIIRDAYGDEGLDGKIIEGFGLLCSRYNGSLDDPHATAQLRNARGGLGALKSKAGLAMKQTGRPYSHCIAAAAVELINAGSPRTKKLPNWWTAS